MIKKFFFAALLSSFLLVVIISGCSNQTNEMSNEELTSRGAYLLRQGLCNDCHSPKVMTPEGPFPDSSRLMSGHRAGTTLPPIDSVSVMPGNWIMTNNDLTAWVGPWGISFAANLTPDGPTGIGTWTEEIFIKALRTGKHMGAGRSILPPMPWPDIGKATDEDLKAIFAFLKSLKPIRNPVPEPVSPDRMLAGK